MFKKLTADQATFFCFTPLVSLLTFIIELTLALYILFRYKTNSFNLLTVVIILLLGTFQLSEYMLCTSENLILWGRIGAASITLLPALGLHLITFFTKKSWLVIAGYIFGVCLMSIIFFLPSLTIDTRCTVKFVILLPQTFYQQIFIFYYVGFLFIGIFAIIHSLATQTKNYNSLIWMLIGYLSFILPTIIVFILYQTTRQGIPSIMCGFAIFLAVVLAFKVIPGFNKKSKK